MLYVNLLLKILRHRRFLNEKNARLTETLKAILTINSKNLNNNQTFKNFEQKSNTYYNSKNLNYNQTFKNFEQKTRKISKLEPKTIDNHGRRKNKENRRAEQRTRTQ